MPRAVVFSMAAMIRAAAKNHAYVTVVTDPQDYPQVIEALRSDDGQTAYAFRQKLAARAYARSAAAEMHSGFGTLRSICSMTVGQRIKLHDTPPALVRDIARLDALWNHGFMHFGGPYLAGDAFTAVDAFFAPVAFRVQTYGLGFELSETARAYVDRLLAHPALVKWYDEALKETVRDADHEAGQARVGTVIEDLRAA